MTRRVGILGGTFNPIHKGHIDLGLQIREAFELDAVLYVLSAHPPHKKHKQMVSAETRWQMLTIALAEYPQLVPCDIEMKRPVDSWTIVTIEELQQTFPQDRFYFISGSEGFLKIRTWKDHSRLLRMLPFIVVLRNLEHQQEVTELLADEGITPIPYRRAKELDEAQSRVYFYTYDSQWLHLSSTMIRSRAMNSESVDGFVHRDVKKIMEEKGLYEK